MKHIVLLIPVLMFISCSETERRIAAIESNFGIDFPDCYQTVEDNSYSEFQDYTIDLKFQFNEACFADLQQELEKAQDYHFSLVEGKRTYVWNDGKSESSVLSVDEETRVVRYKLVHI